MENETKTSLSQSTSLEELADFWDSHDMADFEAETEAVEMTFDLKARRHYVAIDPDLLNSLRETAQMRGLTTESLVNLWLQERLQQAL